MHSTSSSEESHGHASPQRRHERGAPRDVPSDVRRKLHMARFREVAENLGAQFNEQAHKRPLVVIGAAAGVGFVAGSLFGSRFGQMLLALGAGYAIRSVLGGDLGVERIQAGLEKLTGEAVTE